MNPFKQQKPKSVYMPKPQTPAPPPPPPAITDPETEAGADEKTKKYKDGAVGRASTFLSGGSTTDALGAVKFLGGAAKT